MPSTKALKRVVFLLVYLLLVSVSRVNAESYVIGTENLDYRPFSGVENKQFVGYFRELLDQFGMDSGNEFVYKPMPVKRLMNALTTGQIDFKIPDNKFWASGLKKGHHVQYSQPVTVYVDGILVLPANKGGNIERLTSMVTVRGFTPFPFMDEIAKGAIRLQETTTQESVIKMVVGGRAFGAFMNITVADRVMGEKLAKPGMLVFDDQLPAARSEISLSTVKHPELLQQLDGWLASHSDQVAKLKKQYGVP